MKTIVVIPAMDEDITLEIEGARIIVRSILNLMPADAAALAVKAAALLEFAKHKAATQENDEDDPVAAPLH